MSPSLRGSDLESRGLARQYLHRLYRKGVLDRVDHGLYTLASSGASEHQTLIEAARRVPHGVVCLLSALRFHVAFGDAITPQPEEAVFPTLP